MISNTLQLFLIVYFASESYGHKAEKFFRDDYIYMDAFHSFYKIHTLPMTWADTKRVCALEGATLWHPENDNEANEILSIWNKAKPNIQWVFVGLSDLLIEDVFETVDGKSISQVYNNWEPGQPDNHSGKQGCVRLNLVAKYMDDEHCYLKYPFICKKSLDSLQWNKQCNMSNLDYTYNRDTDKCYKLHTTPLTWPEAYTVCQIEQSHLAVIRSWTEADYLAKFTESTPKPGFKGKYQKGIYHLGFHSRLGEGWQTVRGSPVNLDTDFWFDKYQPDNNDPQACGSMLHTGHLINIDCDTKSFFICDHEIDRNTLPLSAGSDDSMQSFLNPYVGGGIE